MKKRRLINDILLIVALVIIPVFIILANMNPGNTSAGTVIITVDGDLYASEPLSGDSEITITTDKGMNIVMIRDGKAWVSDASCNEQVCVRHRAISKTGEQIICLPHRVVIEITDGAEKDIDSISQ
jgi:hypothetical protein